MQRDDIVVRIRAILERMSPILEVAGIIKLLEHKGQLCSPLPDASKALDWVRRIYEQEFQEAKKMRNLLPEEMWERYKAWGNFDDHTETKWWNASVRKLKKALVTNKPIFFRIGACRGWIKEQKARTKCHKEAASATHPVPDPEVSGDDEGTGRLYPTA